MALHFGMVFSFTALCNCGLSPRLKGKNNHSAPVLKLVFFYTHIIKGILS
jgi:hypothetical protein